MALPRLLRKLYSLGSFTQSPGEWFIPRYVFKEELPLHFEGIFTRAWIDDIPVGIIVDRTVDIRVPHRSWRVLETLGPAFSEAHNGTPLRSIHLHR